MPILALLKNTKLLASIGIVAILVGYYFYTTSQIASLEKRNTALYNEKTSLQADLSSAVAVNESNKAFISALKTDASNKAKIIDSYKSAVQVTESKLQILNSYINDSSKTENGVIAPVLLNTIDTIQEMQKEELK